jgi:hypothetical protein
MTRQQWAWVNLISGIVGLVGGSVGIAAFVMSR